MEILEIGHNYRVIVKTVSGFTPKFMVFQTFEKNNWKDIFSQQIKNNFARQLGQFRRKINKYFKS